LVRNIRSDDVELKPWARNLLASRYWFPVYSYLKRSRCEDAEAKDLTVILLGWLDNDGFIMADPAKGRLRSFMLTSLKHFV
jgi:RNA polymerase sigma-70 factor (ECF subfamily)